MDLVPTNLPWLWGVVTPWSLVQAGIREGAASQTSLVCGNSSGRAEGWAILASLEKGFGIRAFDGNGKLRGTAGAG